MKENIKNYKYILGIESSCDDTSMSIFDSHNGVILSEITQSQVSAHAKYGGIVPEIASREHLTNLQELFNATLTKASLTKKNLHLIAVTNKPGLIGSLLIGVSYAKALGFGLDIPVIGIDHLKAHIFSPFLEQDPPKFPFLSLLVSGGHTHLYLVKSLQHIELIGRTLDDACGEAFDKAAQMLGLTYPGGPNIEKLATLSSHTKDQYVLPLPLKYKKNLDFSYSGLKTALRNLLIDTKLHDATQELTTFDDYITKKSKEELKILSQLAAAFQKAAIGHLLFKTIAAYKMTKIKNIAICGGVSANKLLVDELVSFSTTFNLNFLTPHIKYRLDNASMIAFLAFCELQEQKRSLTFNKLKNEGYRLEAFANSKLSFHL